METTSNIRIACKLTSLLACILLLLYVGGCGGDIAKSSQVLARVDGKEITVNYFERQIRNLPEFVRSFLLRGKGRGHSLKDLLTGRFSIKRR